MLKVVWISSLILMSFFSVGCLYFFVREIEWRLTRKFYLIKNSYFLTLEEIIKSDRQVHKIVELDTSISVEFWVIYTKSDEFDYEKNIFKEGGIILPKPSSKELEDLCHKKNCSMELSWLT